jgi:hypothetical protein
MATGTTVQGAVPAGDPQRSTIVQHTHIPSTQAKEVKNVFTLVSRLKGDMVSGLDQGVDSPVAYSLGQGDSGGG